MEIETIAPIIKKDIGIKTKLHKSADDKNFLKKTPKIS
jgi:hypothetical protein